jgi:GAF domain-containing protein
MNGPSYPDASLPLTDELAGVVARMSGLLLAEDTVETALGLLSTLAHETVPGSCGAGVSIVDEHRRRSSGSTDDRVRQADALQYELDEGPCLAATATRELIRVDDLAQDERWPRWAGEALRLGLHASLSAPMVAADRSLGAVKVYADHPGAFDAHSADLLRMFSAQAAIFVANLQSSERATRLSSGMRDAFHDRDVVSIAKGVLMGRHAIDESAAWKQLLARSQQAGVPVARTAQAVIDTAVRRRR